jgi:hypothetical protein
VVLVVQPDTNKEATTRKRTINTANGLVAYAYSRRGRWLNYSDISSVFAATKKGPVAQLLAYSIAYLISYFFDLRPDMSFFLNLRSIVRPIIRYQQLNTK